jgi:hypothetical protein
VPHLVINRNTFQTLQWQILLEKAYAACFGFKIRDKKFYAVFFEITLRLGPTVVAVGSLLMAGLDVFGDLIKGANKGPTYRFTWLVTNILFLLIQNAYCL